MKSQPILLAILVFIVAACSGAAVSPSTAVPTTGSVSASAPSASAPPSSMPASSVAIELTVYAAASLKSAMEEAKAAYETATPGTTRRALDRLVGRPRDPDRAGSAG